MKRAAYPKYKESGVPWLGEVPEGWEIKGLRHVCRLAYGGSLAAEGREEGDVGVYGSNGQVGTHVLANTQAPVIVVGRKGSFGKLNYSKVPVYAIDTTYFIDPSCTKNNLCWLNYALLPLRLDQTSKDSAVPGLAREDAYQNKVPVPSPTEQTVIADFLDRETGRIDTLVAKKRALIGLLKEKRTTLISRTVTRGLPADVAREFGIEPHSRFKDSGVEWLGEVPEGWELKQLKWSIMFQRGHDLPTEKREEGTIPLVTSAGISATHSVAAAKGPGIVTGRYGTIGEFYLVEQDYWPLNTTLYSITTWGNDLVYLCYMLSHLKPLFVLNAVKSAVPGIDRNDIHTTMTAVPPLPEQTAIAAYLDRETAKLDKLMEKVETAITRLQEYRTALITAAVTGKIDVRQETS